MLLASTFAAAELSSFTTSQTTTCSSAVANDTTAKSTLSIATSARHASSSWRMHRYVRARRGWLLRRWLHWQLT